MYSYIKGIIKKITPKYIVLENNAIGYQIITANPYSFSLNEELTVFVYQYVKEDILDLYGFKTEEEKELFLKLISVNGIGPKSALSILASATVNEICQAIEARNDAYLKKFPGIGPKASLQIILDLKGKVSFEQNDTPTNNPKSDTLIEALCSLGYSKKDATKAVGKLDLTKDEGILIKEALKILTN